MDQDNRDQREWAKKSWKSLAQRHAEELETLCKNPEKRLGEIAGLSSIEDVYEWRRSLCKAILGTDSLREYALELHDYLFATKRLKRLPRLLLVNTKRGAFGLFNPSFKRTAEKEYERIQIKVKQPVEIERALKRGDVQRVTYLRRRLKRWEKEFEKLYKEPASKGYKKLNALQVTKLVKNRM